MNNTHKLFNVLFGLLLLETVFLGIYYNNLISGLVIGIPAFLLPFYFFKSAPKAQITKHVTAISTMIFAALHIHQTYGLIEVHFEIFLLMAMLIIFQDWRVFVTALAVIAVHHLSFYYLQTSNAGVFVFDPNRLAFSTVLVHAIYATVEACVAGYIAKLMKSESHTGQELQRVAGSLMSDEAAIDLKIRTNDNGNEILLSFNELLSRLNQLIERIKTEVIELNKNSNSLEATKLGLYESSTQSQTETDMIASAAEQMATTVSSISQDMHALNEQMNQVNKFTQITNDDITQITEQNNHLVSALESTENQISKLVNSVEGISSVLSDITGIAEQTNLLALNAAIEAARAGEQGRGFAVVADEVRALANRTKESTDKIETTINSLMDYSSASSSSMANSLKVVQSVLEKAEKARQQVESTTSVVDEATQVYVSVAAAVEEQSSTTDSIAQSTETLRHTIHLEKENVESIGQDAMNVQQTVDKLEQSILSFK